MSFCTKPTVAPKNAVIAPTIATVVTTTVDPSHIGLVLKSRKTPAVTIVAAWIRADTGVGPSIASGNQVCNPICADLPAVPTNSIKPIVVPSMGVAVDIITEYSTDP